jgi:hypothetical protein
MRSACDRKRSELIARLRTVPPPERGVNQNLRTVVETFVKLQQQRHTPDYDNSTKWTRIDVLAQIAEVAAAFQSWKIVRDEKIAQDFLVYLLIRDR